MQFRILLFSITYFVLSSTQILAQPGFVDLKNGERFEGIVDLTNLEDDGIVHIANKRQELTFSAADAVSFFVHKQGYFYIRNVNIHNSDFLGDSREVIIQLVEEGRLSLWKAFGVDFNYVIEEKKELIALQSLPSIPNQVRGELYRETLNNAFSECPVELPSYDFSDSESDLIDLINSYYDCIEQKRLSITKSHIGVSLEAGYRNSTSGFSIESPHFLEEGVFYSFDYESKSTFVDLGIHLYNQNMLFDFGLSVSGLKNEYKPVLTDSVLSGNTISFNELVLRPYVEPKLEMGRIFASIKTGFNLHFYLNDRVENDIVVEVIRKRPPERILELTPIEAGQIRSSMFQTLFIAPSINVKLNESMLLGFNYYFSTEAKEVLTKENELSFDSMTNARWGARFIYLLN